MSVKLKNPRDRDRFIVGHRMTLPIEAVLPGVKRRNVDARDLRSTAMVVAVDHAAGVIEMEVRLSKRRRDAR
jgi:hypothetical protein